MKVAICAICKNENLYIREWIEWHKNIGISKIFLYDNNDTDGELVEPVIHDYIESGLVDLDTKYRGSYGLSRQMTVYTNCYLKKCKDYDWCAFIDIDKFINTDGKDINDILSNKIYNEFLSIRLFYKMYTDNGLVTHGDTYNVRERFTEWNTCCNGKSIIRCNEPEIPFINCHGSEFAIPTCDATGIYEPYLYEGSTIGDSPIYEVMWVDHFRYKSLEEYIKKMDRGYPYGIKGVNPWFLSLEFYFRENEKTQEKLDYLKSIGREYEH